MTPRGITAALLLTMCCATAWAGSKVNVPAVIVFKNGIKKSVILVERDSESVTVQLPNGKTEKYSTDDIKSIDWKLPDAYKAGEDLLLKGDYAKALKNYDITIEKESNAWCVEQARLRKVQCCLILGKYEEAVREYLTIVKSAPDSDSFARLPLPEGKSPENAMAAKFLKATADASSDDLVKGMALGLAAAARAADKNCKEAEELVKSMLAIPNPKIQGFAKILYGEIAVEKEDYAGAVKILTQNMKDIPDVLLPAAYFWLGRAYFGLDEYDKAAIAFLRAPTYMRDNPEIAADCLYFGAKTFEKADRWAEATRLYEDLTANFPGARHIKDAKETMEKLRKIGGGG